MVVLVDEIYTYGIVFAKCGLWLACSQVKFHRTSGIHRKVHLVLHGTSGIP